MSKTSVFDSSIHESMARRRKVIRILAAVVSVFLITAFLVTPIGSIRRYLRNLSFRKITHEMDRTQVVEIMGEPDAARPTYMVWRSAKETTIPTEDWLSRDTVSETITTYITHVVWFRDGKVFKKHKFSDSTKRDSFPSSVAAKLKSGNP